MVPTTDDSTLFPRTFFRARKSWQAVVGIVDVCRVERTSVVKIAFVIDHLRPDGTQRVLLQLTRGLAARGHRQTVFCLNHSYDPLLVQQLEQVCESVNIIGLRALALGYGAVAL